MNPLEWFKKKEPKLNEDGTPAPPISQGELWYNRIVYQGVNYWLNLAISLVVTDFFLHGKGAGFYKNTTEKFTNGLAAVGFKRPLAKWISGVGAGTFSLNSGGNILLIPTKIAEDNKRNIVHWLNDKLGVDQTAPDGHKMTPEEIYIEQEQPKQSWGNMIWRRAQAWAATTTVGMALDIGAKQKYPLPKMIDGQLQTHKGGQDVFTDWTKKWVNSGLNKVGGQSIVNNETAQRYMSYAALDWIYTIITSNVMHKTNGAGKMQPPDKMDNNGEKPPSIPASDSVNPEQVEESIPPPKNTHACDILRNKDKDENYTASIARRSAEAAGNLSLSA